MQSTDNMQSGDKMQSRDDGVIIRACAADGAHPGPVTSEWVVEVVGNVVLRAKAGDPDSERSYAVLSVRRAAAVGPRTPLERSNDGELTGCTI